MQALRASVIANPTLTWENTLTYNAGFDFTMEWFTGYGI